jgi:hypothetical protein
MPQIILRRLAGLAVIGLITALAAACGPHSGGTTSADQASARAAASSAMANPTVSAELGQARNLVKTCFAGTPTQQLSQVHLVFASSATGEHGPQVVAARAKTFGCLGIPENQRQNFVNDALTAAEHANPKLTTHDGRVTYFEATLPQLILKYKNAGATPGASQAPGATPQPAITGSRA